MNEMMQVIGFTVLILGTISTVAAAWYAAACVSNGSAKWDDYKRRIDALEADVEIMRGRVIELEKPRGRK